MSEAAKHQKRVLYLVVCAAPPATQSSELITSAQDAGWDVCVIATPEAMKFIDSKVLASQTGYQVRNDYKPPSTEDVIPKPDAIVVVPATFNTLNKWAQGIADTLAVSILCEHLGRGTQIIAIPYLKAELARHPAFSSSINLLKRHGVKIIHAVTNDDFAVMPQSKDILAEIIASQTAETPKGQRGQRTRLDRRRHIPS